MLSEAPEIIVFLSTMGVTFSVLSNLAPIPGIYSAWRKKSVETLSHSYLVMATISGFLWVVYAIRTLNSAIIPSNSFSVVINSLYLMIYHFVTGDPMTFGFKLVSGIIAIGITMG